MDDRDRECLRPTNEELQSIFIDAARTRGEATIDVLEDAHALFARAVFGASDVVRPGDRVRAGVAMRTLGDEVVVHPFVLREVCINGAVRAHATSTRIVARQRINVSTQSAHAYSLDALRADLTSAIDGCASPASFQDGVDEMRAALAFEAEQAIDLLQFTSMIGSLGTSRAAQCVARALWRLMRQLSQAGGRDRTAFAFGNALTAAGRDAPVPAARWALEEYGAAVFGASRAPSNPPVATLRGRAQTSDAGPAR